MISFNTFDPAFWKPAANRTAWSSADAGPPTSKITTPSRARLTTRSKRSSEGSGSSEAVRTLDEVHALILQKGNKNALRHGLYTAEAIALRRLIARYRDFRSRKGGDYSRSILTRHCAS